MGFLHKDLHKRNEVYNQLIDHFKNKIVSENKNTPKSEYIMFAYDEEIKKADSGEAYTFENLLALGFCGLSMGLSIGGTMLDEPVFFGGALVSSGISVYNYIKYKRLTLGRSLGTRMFYAETLQNILEEDNFKFPFRSGELKDYEDVEAYVNIINKLEERDLSDN